MVSDTECDYLGEDKRLAVGKQVMAFWCKEGFYYHGEGIIVKIARDNVTVQLQQQVDRSDEFTIGQTIRLPRIRDSIHWSSRNCVRLKKKMALAV